MGESNQVAILLTFPVTAKTFIAYAISILYVAQFCLLRGGLSPRFPESTCLSSSNASNVSLGSAVAYATTTLAT